MEPVRGDSERVRCVHCGEGILAHARICPHCRLSALVDVLGAGPLDEKRRYGLARALLGAGLPGSPALSAIQAELKAAPPRLGRGLTREQAGRLVELARAAGVEARVEIADPALRPAPAARGLEWSGVARRRDGPYVAALAGSLLLALVVIGFLKRSPSPGPGPVARSPVRAPVPAPARSTPAPVADAPKAPPRQALASVVAIRCGKQAGSGFFVAPDLVMTNAHVLCGPNTPVQVSTMDGRKALGKVERLDEYLDLGLVRVRLSGEPRSALLPADAAQLEPGSRVFFAGSPAGLDFTFHEGRVSRVGQPILGLTYVQIDARVNPGNSGGPLLDELGRVVGVVSMKVEGEGLGLALPINYAFDAEAHPFLPGGADWVPSESFQRLAAVAKVEDMTNAGEIAESLETPTIIRIRNDAHGRPLILVGRLARSEPRAEDFRFAFRSGTEVLCWRTAHTARWEEQLQDLPLPPRMAVWLQEHRMTVKLFTTEVSPGLSGCPSLRGRSVSIVLKDGEGFSLPADSR